MNYMPKGFVPSVKGFKSPVKVETVSIHKSFSLSEFDGIIIEITSDSSLRGLPYEAYDVVMGYGDRRMRLGMVYRIPNDLKDLELLMTYRDRK